MAGMKIVGKVALKVWPDLRGFRKELKTGAERAANGVDVTIEAAVNETTLQTSTRLAVAKINKMARTDDSLKIKLHASVDVDTSALRAAAAAARAAGGPTQRIVDEDDVRSATKVRDAFQHAARFVADMRGDVWDMASRAEQMVKHMQVAVRESTAPRFDAPELESFAQQFRREWERFYQRLPRELEVGHLIIEGEVVPEVNRGKMALARQRIINAFKRMKLFVDPDLDDRSVAAIRTRLRSAFRKVVVPIKAAVDTKSFKEAATWIKALSGARLAGKVFKVDVLRDLDLMLPRLAAWTAAIGASSGAVLALAGTLLVLGRNLAQIGPLALALPGVFTGLAVGAVVLGVALSDMNERIPQLAGMMKRLKATISDSFWAEAEQPMRRLVRSTFPAVNAGLGTVATAAGRFASSLSSALGSIVVPSLGAWFDAVGKGFANFSKQGAPGLALVVKGFGDLGAHYLPQFATWVGKITNQFGTFLTNAVKSGEAFAWVELAKQRLGELWGVLKGTWGVLNNLSKAAENAGSTGLKGLGDSLNGLASSIEANMDSVSKWFAAGNASMSAFSAQAGPGLRQMFSGLTSVISPLLTMLGDVAGSLVGMTASVLGSQPVIAGFIGFVKSLTVALSTLRPALPALAEGLGALLTLAGTMATQFAPILAVAFGAAGNAANGLLAALNQVVPALAGGLVAALVAVRPAIEQLTPVISGLIVTIGTALGGALTALAPAIGSLMSGLVPLFTALANVIGPLIAQLTAGLVPILSVIFIGLGQVAAALAPIVSLVGGILSTVLGIVLGALQQMAAAVMPAIVDAIGNLASALAPVLQGIQAFLTATAPYLQAFLAWLMTTIALAIPGIINGIADLVRGATGVIMGIVAVFQGVFTSNWQMAWDGVKQILAGAWDAIKGIIEVALNVGVLGIVRKGIALIKGAFSDGVAAIQLSWEAGWKGIQNIATVVWNAIKGGVSSFFTAIKGIFSTGTQLIKLGWEGFWLGIKIAAEVALKGLTGAIKTGIDGVVSMFRALPSKIIGALGDLGSLLVDSGRSMLDGLARGINQGVAGAVGAATNAMDAIRRLFPHSPAKEGPFSGKGWTLYSGMAISEALAEGIAKKESVVHSTLKDMLFDASVTLNNSREIGRASSEAITVTDDGAGSGNHYEFNLEVPLDEISQVSDLVEFAETLRRRARALGGKK